MIFHFRRQNGSEDGFTLVEVLITIAILLIGVAAIVGVTATGQRAAKRAHDFVNATILGNELAAEALYVGYDSVLPRSGTVNHIAYTTTITTATAASGLYKILDVSMTWRERNQDRTKSFFTYVPDLD